MSARKLSASPGLIVLVIAAIQFANVLDFMMVIPMGPDFATALGIPLSRLGWIAGSYTLSAALAGILGSFCLDRFDRKRALVPAMLGLAVSTVAGGFSLGFGSLLATRLIAGIFGGPATSLSIAIVADVVAPERRARAMSTVMAASAVASILGVPSGLELARAGGWRAPFFAIGALNVLITAMAVVVLPAMGGHLHVSKLRSGVSQWASFLRPEYWMAIGCLGLTMLSGFLIFPNLSAYLQFNMGLPRKDLAALYAASGVVGLVAMKLSGRIVDRRGSTLGAFVSSFLYIIFMYLVFVRILPWITPLIMMTSFQVIGSLQRVSVGSLTTRVPGPTERARYMSVQSAVQHLTSALGSIGSSHFLSTLPDNRLVGMDRIAWISIALTAVLPFGLRRVEKAVKFREKPQPQFP